MVQEAGGDRRPFRMILNRYYRGFGAKRAVNAFEQNTIGEFQRTVDHKQDFVRRTELDDGVLKVSVLAFDGAGLSVGVTVGFAMTIAIYFFMRRTTACGAAQLDGYPHRCGFGKEPGQAAYDIGFVRASSSLVGHSNLNPGGVAAAESSSSRFGRAIRRLGSACSAFHCARAAPKT